MKSLQMFMQVWNNYYSKKFEDYQCVYLNTYSISITRRDDYSFLNMVVVNHVIDLCRALDLECDTHPVQLCADYKPEIIVKP